MTKLKAYHLLNLEAIIIFTGNPIGEQAQNNNQEQRPACSIFRDLGKNDLSINDIVVKSADTNIVCIKARFSLAIKIEEAVSGLSSNNNEGNTNVTSEKERNSDDLKVVLGYLPLDSVTSVIDSCPKPKAQPKPEKKGEVSNTTESSASSSTAFDVDDDELEMIVSFECGKLAFVFRKEEKFYVSSIDGMVNLDSNITVRFSTDKPVFFTTDLNHHFKYNDLVEINSRDISKAFILTANFYHTEFEVFRTTTSRDFTRPPDDNSKPFEPEEEALDNSSNNNIMTKSSSTNTHIATNANRGSRRRRR